MSGISEMTGRWLSIPPAIFMLLIEHIIIKIMEEVISLLVDYINLPTAGYLGRLSTQRLLLPIILMAAMLFPLVHPILFLQLKKMVLLWEVFIELPMVEPTGTRLLLISLQLIIVGLLLLRIRIMPILSMPRLNQVIMTLRTMVWLVYSKLLMLVQRGLP